MLQGSRQKRSVSLGWKRRVSIAFSIRCSIKSVAAISSVLPAMKRRKLSCSLRQSRPRAIIRATRWETTVDLSQCRAQ
jgi:hypothetical protein